MTLQTLIALMVAFPRFHRPEKERMDETQIPRWERHPYEQRALRNQDREDAARWLRIPRGY